MGRGLEILGRGWLKEWPEEKVRIRKRRPSRQTNWRKENGALPGRVGPSSGEETEGHGVA